jgi:hypothetical protein
LAPLGYGTVTHYTWARKYLVTSYKHLLCPVDKKMVTGKRNICAILRGKTHFAPKCFPSLLSGFPFGGGRAEMESFPQSSND